MLVIGAIWVAVIAASSSAMSSISGTSLRRRTATVWRSGLNEVVRASRGAKHLLSYDLPTSCCSHVSNGSCETLFLQ
jgi:hypothetical protein